ncbi:ABC transporter ATP-binding protein [Pararobbsia silviterrae]|uniref:ABC transporter ATP-binding protein n=1 Tax=Pararobbsia silviterrae TaxID=1792498 RepID=A0A494XRU2_9BURK|nr:ABC transporter ATP-binding protein [Pararobbsia silviterrae]RKP53358.1 ABC transporter ATP-binding protein [Pararobbsia silviterrae]
MTALKVRGLEAQHGLLKAVRGVDLDLQDGERLALVGANGAGKTTLLRTLAGIHRASAGTIEFDGVDVTSTPAHRRASMGIALVPEGRRLFGSLSVIENLRVASAANRKGAWNVDTVLDAFPQLKPKIKAAAGSLSGGQQQAVAIGRALMTNPRLLLLDEVSLGLSPAAVQGVYESLATVVKQRTTLILVEQDLQRTFDFAERIVCMLEGGVVATGRTDQMTRDEVMGYYFGHRVRKESEAHA